MGTDLTKDDSGGRRRGGRPPRAPEAARSHRVVTFVTGRELAILERIAEEEDRSLSAVVHRIIVQQLKDVRPAQRYRSGGKNAEIEAGKDE